VSTDFDALWHILANPLILNILGIRTVNCQDLVSVLALALVLDCDVASGPTRVSRNVDVSIRSQASHWFKVQRTNVGSLNSHGNISIEFETAGI
jgi:hypothetical protein